MVTKKQPRVGDVRVAPNGYHYTYVNDTEKFVLTHRHLAEVKILHRRLYENEYVAFIDGDRTNIKVSNIEVRKRKVRSINRKIAQLIARRDAIDHEIQELKLLERAKSSGNT